jgi:hypothetical protein
MCKTSGAGQCAFRLIERADLALTDANAATSARLLAISVDEYRAAHQRARERPAGTPV